MSSLPYVVLNKFFFLYFLQGMSYGVCDWLVPVIFKEETNPDHGAWTLLNLATLPCVCTAFWQPLVGRTRLRRPILQEVWLQRVIWSRLLDRFGTRVWWLLISLLSTAFVSVMAVFYSVPTNVASVFVLVTFLSVTSATLHMSITSAAIAATPRKNLGTVAAAYVAAARLGSTFGTGLLYAVYKRHGWSAVFTVLSFVLLAAFMYFRRKAEWQDPVSKTDDDAPHARVSLRNAALLYVEPEGTLWLSAYLLVHRVGVRAAVSYFPFFLIDHGSCSVSSVGFWSVVAGDVLLTVGAIISGHVTSRPLASLKNLMMVASAVQWLVIVLQNALLLWNQVWPHENSCLPHVWELLAMLTLLAVKLCSGVITALTVTAMLACTKNAGSNLQASHFACLSTVDSLGKMLFFSHAFPLLETLTYSHAYVFILCATLKVLCLIEYFPQNLSLKEAYA